MDIERAMQAILERQAAHEVEIAEIRAIVRENAAQMKEQGARQTKTDRRVDAIAKLLQTGMKMLVKFERESKEGDRITNQQIDALGKKVDRLVDGLQGRHRNGHGTRR